MPMNYEFIYPRNLEEFCCLRLRDIEVSFDPSFNRQKEKGINRLIEKEKSILKRNGSQNLYNKTKFRLHSILKTSNKLVINIGITDYFEYLCTNHNKALNQKLVKAGHEKFGDPDVYLSNALGNVAVVGLTDEKIILLKRSNHVHTFKGYYDLPGGHPEPCRISSANMSSNNNIAIELFNSIQNELEEELDIKDSNILDVLNIGFLKSLEDGRKPEMLFYVPLNLSSIEIIESFKKRDKNSSEAIKIAFYDFNRLDEIDLKTTAVAEGTIKFFREICRLL